MIRKMLALSVLLVCGFRFLFRLVQGSVRFVHCGWFGA